MEGTVSIGNSQRELQEADPQWIAEQLVRRRDAGEKVCVRVTISTANVSITLTSADCPSGPPSGRKPNPEEAALFEAWRDFGLDGSDFPPGKLVAFLQRMF